MKKEKKINELEDVEKIETENFDISETGSLSDDLISFEKLNDLSKRNLKLFKFTGKFYKCSYRNDFFSVFYSSKTK